MSRPRKPKRMVWTRSRLKVLVRLVAADPLIGRGELAEQFNAATRCAVSPAAVADACRYYGVRQVTTAHSASGVGDPASLVRQCIKASGRPAPQAGRELAARKAMVSWLDPEQLVKAVGPIIKEAITWCSRLPGQEDPQELEAYDPELPESWWDPEVFLDNVLQGLEDELRRQFDEAGMPEREEEMWLKVRARSEARAPGLSGSLFDSLDDSNPSVSMTDTHAMKPAGLEQDRPVISAST